MQRESGKYVTSVLSVEHPCCPLVPGVQRGQVKGLVRGFFVDDVVNLSFQVGLGSGWVLEPFQDDPNKTLVTYSAHVSSDIMSFI